MKVIHIAGGFAQQALYPHLVQALRPHCERQFVFAPVRTAAEKQRQPENAPGEVEYVFEHILKRHHRLMFRRKVDLIYHSLLASCDVRAFDLIHAHTLYSDGAVAVRIKESWGIPYVVAFRNTDLNVFMRYRPDLRRIGESVLAGAGQVIFLSPAYRGALLARLGKEAREDVERKSVVVPNGLADFWLERSEVEQRSAGRELRLLYVGEFSRNKNVRSILRAAAELSKRRTIRATLVGGGGSDDGPVRRMLANGQFPFVDYLGRISELPELRSVYQQNDVFVMPSHKETFGMVYLEALSQGLPFVHSRGQGVDGYFEEGTVCEAVDPNSITDIVAGIERLASRREHIRQQCIAEAKNFRWSNIGAKYAQVYADAPDSQTQATEYRVADDR